MRQRKGIALYLTYVVILAFLTFGSITIVRGINSLNLSRRNRASQQALYISESAINAVAYNLSHTVPDLEDETTNPMLTSTPRNINTLTLWAPPASFPPTGFTATYTCQMVGSETTTTDPSGIATMSQSYEISATTTHIDYDIAVTIKKKINRKKTYIFQYGVFYVPDLEIEPLHNMTFTGKIHGNSNIYLDCGSAGKILKIDSNYLYSAGHILQRKKDTNAHGPGYITIKIGNSSTYNYMNPNPGTAGGPYYDSQSWPSAEGNWTTGAITRWGGNVKDSSHGVSALSVPSVGSIQPTGRYAQNAGLYIYNNEVYTGLPPALGGSGTLLVEGPNPGDLPPGTITTTDKFKNNREGRFISMTDIDMRKLAGYASASETTPSHTSRLPANGLVYVTRNTAVGVGTQPGIRLKNGSQIYNSTGVTLVSNDPVYVQGDYNNVSKKPAAIICDSLNILSNAWSNDTYSTGNTNRNASNTTVNAAFIAGVKDTVGSTQGGGFENYPRLHEKWDNGSTLAITGSFVSLGQSTIATGAFQYGWPQYYPPTNRNWNYDTAFNNSGNLPPFTPYTVETESVVWWQDASA